MSLWIPWRHETYRLNCHHKSSVCQLIGCLGGPQECSAQRKPGAGTERGERGVVVLAGPGTARGAAASRPAYSPTYLSKDRHHAHHKMTKT
eukprot:6175857-Pleurochrysis_carterae.AAC.3